MEIINFLKTLNKKIDSYNKSIPKSNPFLDNNHVTLIWIDEECPIKERFE